MIISFAADFVGSAKENRIIRARALDNNLIICRFIFSTIKN
jgi:hypothetical protein